jgi:hypothetical protein
MRLAVGKYQGGWYEATLSHAVRRGGAFWRLPGSRQRPILTGQMRYREWLREADMPTQKLTAEIITAAILGFEQQMRQIDTKIGELRSLLPGGPAEPTATQEAPARKRKKFSAAARRRMKEAQQRRWAKIRGESEPPEPTQKPAKPKRQLSKAGRENIVAALKKRWAEKKAAAKKAAVKKAAVAPAKKKMSPARRTAQVANLAKARAARAAKRTAGGKVPF